MKGEGGGVPPGGAPGAPGPPGGPETCPQGSPRPGGHRGGDPQHFLKTDFFGLRRPPSGFPPASLREVSEASLRPLSAREASQADREASQADREASLADREASLWRPERHERAGERPRRPLGEEAGGRPPEAEKVGFQKMSGIASPVSSGPGGALGTSGGLFPPLRGPMGAPGGDPGGTPHLPEASPLIHVDALANLTLG